MKKLIVGSCIGMMFAASNCRAGDQVDGRIYFGHYFSSSYTDLAGRSIRYRAGIELKFHISDGVELAIEDETYILSERDGGGFIPGQVNYKLEIKKTVGAIDLSLKHQCLHPIEVEVSGQNLNLVEIGYSF